MEKVEKRKFLFSALFPFLFVVLLWLIKWVEIQFEFSLSEYGVLPRNLVGLRGVLFSPLIHGDVGHLFNNSVPLIVLGWTLFYFYRSIAFKVVFWSYLLAGLYTWISARYSYHIGASGLVYALFGFIFISGFIRRYIPLIAISFLVAFLYGSLIWGILPWDHKMSWEGHFWGLFVGLILAVYYRKKGPQRKKYIWEEDDEEMEEKEFSSEVEGSAKPVNPPQKDSIEYVYHFVPGNKQNSEDKTK